MNISSRWRVILGSATTFWTLLALGAVAMFWQRIADSLHVGYPVALIKIAATIEVAIGGALVLSAIVLSTRHRTNGGSHG